MVQHTSCRKIADVDCYLAGCGPAFWADCEQRMDYHNLFQLVIESDALSFTEAKRLSTHEVIIGRRHARCCLDEQHEYYIIESDALSFTEAKRLSTHEVIIGRRHHDVVSMNNMNIT
jgi:hypothetical protein